MKFGLMLGLGLLWLPYGSLVVTTAGNPNDDSYLGKPGSTYDSAANPPQTVGVEAYNPMAPLPKPATPATPALPPR